MYMYSFCTSKLELLSLGHICTSTNTHTHTPMSIIHTYKHVSMYTYIHTHLKCFHDKAVAIHSHVYMYIHVYIQYVRNAWVAIISNEENANFCKFICEFRFKNCKTFETCEFLYYVYVYYALYKWSNLFSCP